MKKSVIFFLAFAIAAIFGLLYLRLPKEKIPESGERVAVEATNANLASLQPVVSPIDVSNNVQSAEAINTTSAPVQIMEKTPQQIIAEKNSRSQDFYGKAVDQYGQPVPDAEVSGALIIETDEGFNTEPHTTKTDLDGLFEFTGLHGADLNVKIKKDGYKLGDRGEGRQGAIGGISNPNNRAIFTMWKIHGAEPLVGSTIEAAVPYDGTSAVFDMATGKESSNGDLKVTLSRFPQQLKRGLVHPYDWRFKIELLNGGLLEERDPYPYWAPDNGYQPSFEFEINSNSIPWMNQSEENFYIKNTQGQYGLMKFIIYSAPTPAGVHINITINPSGSQNLEPDLSK